MEQIRLDWEPQRRILTVAELTASIKALLVNSFENIWVAGEISGSKLAASGHAYFTLKDAGAQIRCVCYKSAMRWVKFKPQDGIAVVARGRIDLYEPRGEYQLIVETLEPQGFGQLQVAFDQLKQELEAEGLFAASRKRPLPAMPSRIGIVTSPTGAVIRDMLHVLERRFPGLHIRLYPAQVQGVGSVEAVVEGIEYFGKSGWAEVLIVGRGGGSLEDLWTFNEEAVARAIAACPVPVISAVGHETDFTIADFVADLRAPAPSAAAEIVVRTRADVLQQIAAAEARGQRALSYRLAQCTAKLERLSAHRAAGEMRRSLGRAAQRVDELDAALRDRLRERAARGRRLLQDLDRRLRQMDPRVRLGEARHRLQLLAAAAEQRMRLHLNEAAHRRHRLDAALVQLSPLAVLERGYAIVQKEGGVVVRQAAEVSADEELRIRLWKGEVHARVRERRD